MLVRRFIIHRRICNFYMHISNASRPNVYTSSPCRRSGAWNWYSVIWSTDVGHSESCRNEIILSSCNARLQIFENTVDCDSTAIHRCRLLTDNAIIYVTWTISIFHHAFWGVVSNRTPDMKAGNRCMSHFPVWRIVRFLNTFRNCRSGTKLFSMNIIVYLHYVYMICIFQIRSYTDISCFIFTWFTQFIYNMDESLKLC